MGDLFGGSKSDSPKLLEAFPGQMGILKDLAEAAKPKGLEAIGMAGQPTQGPLIAPPSQWQQQGLGQIGDVLSRPMATQSPLFQQGQEALSGALRGFDPFEDQRFKALQVNLARELKKAKDRIASRTSARDEFFGGGRLDQEREQEEGAFGQMANLAGLLEAESRRNQLLAAPMAAQFAGLASEEPVSRLQEALFGIGAAPRGFAQEELSARDAERARILSELSNLGLGTTMETSMFKPDWYVPSYGPSIFSQLAGGIGAMGGLGTVLGGIGDISSRISDWQYGW